MEEEMVTYSTILAWKIPWMKEPSGLQSMVSQSQTQLSMQAPMFPLSACHGVFICC